MRLNVSLSVIFYGQPRIFRVSSDKPVTTQLSLAGNSASAQLRQRCLKSLRLRGFYLALAFAVGFACLRPTTGSAEIIQIMDARLGEHPGKTRFVVEVSGIVNYKIFTLADPYRVVVDLPNVEWKLPFASGALSAGPIVAVRYNHYRASTARIVLDLVRPLSVDKSFLLPSSTALGRRLVIDLVDTSAEDFVLAAGWPATISAAATQLPTLPSIQTPLRKPQKYMIVIDPGHGGRDSGATGSDGTHESDVVLTMAKALKRNLEESGRYRTLLTRKDDTGVVLRNRIAIARESKANLFISLHADSLSGKPNVRGASVYTLSERASDAEAQALANKENRADILLGVNMADNSEEVNDILIDLALRDTKNASVRFARILMSRLGKVTPLLKNTHRFAGFAVLKSPDVPSVLVELGYMSNKKDEKNLKSATWRNKVATSIVKAVDDYFTHIKVGRAEVEDEGTD